MDPLNLEFDGDVLLCPGCKDNYLHHVSVEIFERREDEDGLHVTVENQKVSVDRSMKSNPSRRRHGLLIHFECEQCDNKSVLTLVQHKGQTFLTISTLPPPATSTGGSPPVDSGS